MVYWKQPAYKLTFSSDGELDDFVRYAIEIDGVYYILELYYEELYYRDYIKPYFENELLMIAPVVIEVKEDSALTNMLAEGNLKAFCSAVSIKFGIEMGLSAKVAFMTSDDL